MKPDYALIELLGKVGLLKTIKRTGWVKKGVKNAESVSDHSWRVAILGMFLAKSYKLDINRVVQMSLIHDLGEAGIGDVVWEKGKKVIGNQIKKHSDEWQAVKELFANRSETFEYLDLWVEFNEQKTRVAKFVKQLDKLEMVIQALEYETAGYPNEKFDEFWENAEKYLAGKELENLFVLFKYEREKVSKKSSSTQHDRK